MGANRAEGAGRGENGGREGGQAGGADGTARPKRREGRAEEEGSRTPAPGRDLHGVRDASGVQVAGRRPAVVRGGSVCGDARDNQEEGRGGAGGPCQLSRWSRVSTSNKNGSVWYICSFVAHTDCLLNGCQI